MLPQIAAQCAKLAPGVLKCCQELRSQLAREACATLEAMRDTRQPTGQLGIPPLALPHPSLAAAMHAMVAAQVKKAMVFCN